MNRELVKDIFGLGAVFIFLATMVLASFAWSDDPGPIGALGTVPLILFVAAYLGEKYGWAGRRRRGV